MPVDIAKMQSAILDRELDGWLFCDFRRSDPLAHSILNVPRDLHFSRRWCYFVPARGTPARLVHAIEAGALDHLPGSKQTYLRWTELEEAIGAMLAGSARIAMQYSPRNGVPTVSRVDAGTIELIRSLGVDVVSSADLVQTFEATLSEEQFATHAHAADLVAQFCQEAFDEIGRRVRVGNPATEYDIQQFLVDRFAEHGLETDHPPIVAVDAHSADPHFAPSAVDSRKIDHDRSVLIDLWARQARPEAIYADITRVGFIGTPPEEYVRVFHIVRDARDAAVDAVRTAHAEGRAITGAAVDDVCRGVIDRAGFGPAFIHRTGHSIHQTTHGNGANIDNLETHDTRQLIPRTLFSIEPGIYLTGKFGIRSEINVFLSGSEVLVTGPEPQMEVHQIRGD